MEEQKKRPGRPPRSQTDVVTQPAPTEYTQTLEPKRMSIHEFLDLISVAKLEGQESIEASDEIIKHYNRNGLGGAEYFIYGGVKVYPKGKTTAIEDTFSDPLIVTEGNKREYLIPEDPKPVVDAKA